jgi:Cu(I)/Ag(I) efflux system membrane fusion protein
VKLGLRGRDVVEVLEGIRVGDVVVSANFLIDAESNLKAASVNLVDRPQSANQAKASGETCTRRRDVRCDSLPNRSAPRDDDA